MDRVVVWREELLPASETFIVNQIASLRRWMPVLSGLRTLPRSLGPAPGFTLEGSPELAHRMDRRLYWRLGTSVRLHRHLADVSLVHAHFGPDAARLVRAARLAHRPLIATFHGYDAHIPATELGADYEALFTHAARLIAVSQFIRRRLLAIGAPDEKIRVLPIGIPVAEAPPPGASGTGILFVGRLVEVKGCADLIRAVSQMTAPPPLSIIGDGPLRSGLERLAGDLRVDARFLGAQPPAAVAEAMRGAGVLCVPSRRTADGIREGLGTVFLEAAAHRLPAVSYRSGGIPEAVIDGQTGLLADEGDVAGLARRLEAVAADPALARRLGSDGRRRLERCFDIRRQTALLEAVYDDATFGARGGRPTGAVSA